LFRIELTPDTPAHFGRPAKPKEQMETGRCRKVTASASPIRYVHVTKPE
jgi:hypothetical protein